MHYVAVPGTPPGASSPPPLPWPGQPLPAVGQLAHEEEGDESSDDDPDKVPAELPMFCSLSSPGFPWGQQQSHKSGNLQSDPHLSHTHISIPTRFFLALFGACISLYKPKKSESCMSAS